MYVRDVGRSGGAVGRGRGSLDMIIKLAHQVNMARSKGLKTSATTKHYTRGTMPSSILHSIVKPAILVCHHAWPSSSRFRRVTHELQAKYHTHLEERVTRRGLEKDKHDYVPTV